MEPNSSTASASTDQRRICAVCDAECTQSCSSCNKISYCSREHQKTHWKAHKPDCFPAEIKHNETVGRHLVATKLIRQGEYILNEKPLVTGPNCGPSFEKYHPLCLSCFRIVQSTFVCRNCKWPVCGPQCETMKNHSKNECKIFKEQNVVPFSANESFMYEKIIILRALLCKESDSSTWEKLVNLESHSTKRKEGIKGVLLTQSAIEFIQEACGLHQFTNEEIDHIVGALSTNAFWNNDNTLNMSIFRSGSYLYYYGSMPAHNCIPNSAWTIQMNSEFHLRASVDIPAGDPITQLYTEATLGTLQRRAHLKETKYFECSCSRCADPTELNTNFSALKCSNCTGGYLLPISPLNENSDWICQSGASSCTSTARCGKSKPQYIEDVLQGIRAKINLVNDVDDSSSVEKSLGCINSLRKLLATYTGKILHPNHFFIYEIENVIIQRISYLLATTSDAVARDDRRLTSDLKQMATLMTDLCRKSFHITNTILPGHTTHRGRLMYFLQQGLTASLYLTLTSSTNRKNNQKLQTCPAELHDIIREIDQIRQDASQILSNEPAGREEYLIHQFLNEPSENLKFIRKRLLINDKA